MESISEEIWKDIPGFEFYQASSHGRIRSVDHVGFAKGRKTTRVFKGRVLVASNNPCGYPQVTLLGKHTKACHRLIADAFFGVLPKGLSVNHKDGNKENNRIENLEYVTPKENIRHAIETGLRKQRGAFNPTAKLTESQVREIRSRTGESGPKLAKEFGVGHFLIYAIQKRRAWKHVA